MSYFAVITFDIEKPRHNIHKKITQELEYDDFYKTRKGRKSREFALPYNTYAAEFDEGQYGSSDELAQEVRECLKRIFDQLNVKGRYFVFVGRHWKWVGGTIK